ncbi:MAG: hypothetical protein ABUT39_23475 [Acidobacteriota bacterium]
MSDDELLRRYLLGDLPGDEQEALENRLFTDDDLFELAGAVEAEVLEDYAGGGLSPEQRSRVRRYLAASPEGRLQLAVIEGLSGLPAQPGKVLPIPPRPAALPFRRKVQALAAMLVMAVGAVWLAGIQSDPPDSPRPPQPPSRPPVVAATPEPTPPPAPLEVFVATIALANLRGEAQVPAIDVPSDADKVELRLTLPHGDEGYPSYRIVLNDAADQEVAKGEDLHAGRRSRQIALQVDADQLPHGRYSLTVQGVTREGDVEDLAYPEFDVHEP